MTQMRIADELATTGDHDDSARRARLGDWLVSHGFVTAADVDSALAEQIVTGDFDGFFEKEARTIGVADETQAFEFSGVGSVGGFRGGREPAFVDAAAMPSEGV